MNRMTVEHESLPLTVYVEAKTLQDASDHIYYKSVLGWKTLVEPFLVRRISIQTQMSPNLIPVESLDIWAFVLHRF